MSKLQLKNVTLFTCSDIRLRETWDAIYICMGYADFADVINLTQIPTPENELQYDKWIQYSNFMGKRLCDYIKTDFVLVVQWESNCG